MPSLTKLQKKEQLDEILADLEELKASGKCENRYALEENIKFFRALYTFPKFVRWLFRERTSIEGSRLLELSDFHLRGGKWERILQQDLLEIEQWKFPDLLKQIRTTLIEKINGDLSNGRLVLVNAGCGAMEIERQVISTLALTSNNGRPISFIGIDNSAESLVAAKNNLESVGVKAQYIDSLDSNFIKKEKACSSEEKTRVFLYRGSALSLEKYFESNSIDILFHSKFKHHLSFGEKDVFDAQAETVAKTVVEYDNLNGWFMLFVPIRSQWTQPVLMNGAIFSCLRDPKRQEVENTKESCYSYKFSVDSYVRVFKRENNALPPYLRKIIKAGITAPSGENSQPWKVRVLDDVTLEVMNVSDRDLSLYNINGWASAFSQGAFCENMVIAAACYGYKTEISEFPESSKRDLVSRVTFKKEASVSGDMSLYGAIYSRATNRKSYESKCDDGLRAFVKDESFFQNTSLHFVEDQGSKNRVAILASQGEKVLLENVSVHDFFFKHVSWTNKQDSLTRSGFFVKTFELPKPAEFMFKMVSKWNRLEKMNKTGMVSKKVTEANAEVYRTCGCVGAVVLPRHNAPSFFELGRNFQRFWLNATRLGLFIQPLAGALFLALRVKNDQNNPLSEEHRKLLLETYEGFREVFTLKAGQEIGFLFRIGYAKPPSAVSRRYYIESVIERV